jgi:hypothetical protein
MAAQRKPPAGEEARLLALLLGDGFDEEDDEEDDEQEEEEEEEEEDDEWARPEWLHPDCVNPCLALDLGTCCKDPANPVVRRAVELADAVDRMLGRPDNGECVRDAATLARLLESIPALLAQVHAVLPGGNATAVARLLCPVGRLTAALDQVCLAGCPWACGDPDVPDRRAEFEPLRSLLADCSAALRARVGGQRGQGLKRSPRVGRPGDQDRAALMPRLYPD